MLPREPRTVGWVWDQGRATAPHAADDPAAASRGHTQARTPASRGPPCFGAGAGQEANASLIAARLIIVGRCWLSHGHRGAGSPRGRAALGGSGVRERSWGLCPGVPPVSLSVPVGGRGCSHPAPALLQARGGFFSPWLFPSGSKTQTTSPPGPPPPSQTPSLPTLTLRPPPPVPLQPPLAVGHPGAHVPFKPRGGWNVRGAFGLPARSDKGSIFIYPVTRALNFVPWRFHAAPAALRHGRCARSQPDWRSRAPGGPDPAVGTPKKPFSLLRSQGSTPRCQQRLPPLGVAP